MQDADTQFARNSYIIMVLEGPPGLRQTVKLMAGASSSVGQKQLFTILILFDTLTPDLQLAFINAFKGCATLATQGSREIYRAHSWDPLQIPPRQDP